MKKMDKNEINSVAGGVDLKGLNAFERPLSKQGTNLSNKVDNARMVHLRIEAENKFGKDGFMEFLDQTGNKVYYVASADAEKFMDRLS